MGLSISCPRSSSQRKEAVITNGTQKCPEYFFGICHWLACIKQSMSEDCIEMDKDIEGQVVWERALIQNGGILDFGSRSVINWLRDLGQTPLGPQLSHI